jgi:hypothetical protein
MSDPPDSGGGGVPAYQPDFIHELFWAQIQRMFSAELQRAGAKMGTVSITPTGPTVLVLVDGTSTARPYPRVAGRRFSVGQRVVVVSVNGKPVVVGGVLTGTGIANEGVIDTPDLARGAVMGALTRDGVTFIPANRSLTYIQMAVGGLRGSAVDGDQSIFQQGSIGSRDIGEGQITNSKIDSVNASKITGTISVAAGNITGRIGSGQIGDVGSPGGAGVLGGNIGNDAVGNRNLQEDSVDQRVLANDSVGFQNCTAALQQMIKKAGKGKGKTKPAPAQLTWQPVQPEYFPNDNDPGWD